MYTTKPASNTTPCFFIILQTTNTLETNNTREYTFATAHICIHKSNSFMDYLLYLYFDSNLQMHLHN